MEWVDIRRKARDCNKQAVLAAGGVRHSQAIIKEALIQADLELQRFEPGTTFGKGVLGVLERAEGLVHVASNLADPVAATVTAHEIGHFHLHLDPRNEVTVENAGLAGDRIATGVAKVEGYSPRERKEVQADVFAGEFLCPSDWARDQFVIHGKTPDQIAQELGIPPELALHQVIRAVLLPPLRPAPPIAPARTAPPLDETQKTAAHWKDGPLLVDAGPGTGKTRTLIHRVSHLLETGVPPSAILALTFSNRAADEMRERLAAVHPQAAIEMWVGTFHAFGLELLTKWPSGVGRSSKVKIFDDSESLALLERHLAELPLQHYQNLYEPAYELVHVLRAISRCKDEMISPEQYLAEAQAALASARTDEEKEKAAKAIEVGEVFKVYESKLGTEDAVDFGDLVLNAVSLVERHADVQKYIGGFQHVLVDEYQDVNLASARLLHAIHATGAKVWVVADQRQSIYRFRGAEPSNVGRFASEFKGTRHSLGTNYRSHAPVVQVFERFSAVMGNGGMKGTWKPNRGGGGSVSITVAPDVQAEGEAIRDKIELLRKGGVPYGDQVILARTHLTLARITSVLEELGVPLLYLGDLFERPEIRDLLSLVAVDAEPGGLGLVRVAALPAYRVTREDVLRLIQWARDKRLPFGDALQRTSEVDGLSETGRAGLSKLGRELTGLGHCSPWTLLTTWLFERSEYLKPLLAAGNASAQQKLIAIYHLLKVCSEHASAANASRRSLLDRIRRLEALSQDTSFRAIASEASDIDAVRVMTIHGSKGLEFGAVHFPALATKYMPSNRQGTRCPPPSGLSGLAMDSQAHGAEEECLFFVGLSRAKDHLSLSRAERYTSQHANESKFLASIRNGLSTVRHAGNSAGVSLPVLGPAPATRTRYSERELDVYLRCPARYRYEIIDGLYGARDGSAYIGFHRCVYATVAWLESEKSGGRVATEKDAIDHLRTEWEANGPLSHGFEPYYRNSAQDMVRRMARAIAAETTAYEREEWVVSLGSREVTISPDRVLLAAGQPVVVQRVRTGRETESEGKKAIYALLRRGAAARYPGRPVRVETYYLATGNRVVVDGGNDAKGIQEYAEAIAEIESGAFAPTPEARMCPNCPSYFICRV